jgi:hypothetical protein
VITLRSVSCSCLLAAVTLAQAVPTPWPLGAPVPATIANDTTAPIPFSPFTPTVTAGGLVVYQGLTVGTVLLLPPGETYTGWWMQNDGLGAQVPPGVYDVGGQPFALGATAAGLAPLGAPHVGVARNVVLAAPSQPDAAYVLAAAFGSTTGIALGCGRTFPLDADALLGLSVSGSPLFANFVGTLGPTGTTTAPAVVLPSLPWLVGIAFELAFVTLDATAPCGIGAISGVARTTIV